MLRNVARALAVVSLVSLAACQNGATAHTDPGATQHAQVEREILRAQLATHRAEQIARLEAYAAAGEFPHNYDVAPSLHIFKDGAGRLCAVANLVHQDGRDDIVDDVVRTNDALAVADVRDGAMMQWMLESGLTQEELARIQLPAPPVQRPLVDRVLHPFAQPVAVNGPVMPQPPPAPPGAVIEEQMKSMVRAHVAQVDAELRADTDASLDVAVARLMAARAST